MDQIEDVNFSETGKKIAMVLFSRSMKLDRSETIRFVYNEAIEDACNFVDAMAKSNPQHRMAYVALAKELRHWLPLRE